MTAFSPDLYPGRCCNYRPSVNSYGYPASVRCLELDDVPHVCRFPTPPPSLSSCSMSASRPVPVPWVPSARGDDDVQAGGGPDPVQVSGPPA